MGPLAAGINQLECVAKISVRVALPCSTDAKLSWQYAKIIEASLHDSH